MTEELESVVRKSEQDYEKNLKKIPTRKKGMLIAGAVWTFAYGATLLSQLHPESHLYLGDINMSEHVETIVTTLPAFIVTGALCPEVHKMSYWLMYKTDCLFENLSTYYRNRRIDSENK